MLTQKLNIRGRGQSYGFLRWSEGAQVKQREIDSFISLGRDKDNMIVLEDDFASRRHCRIQRQEDRGFVLQDMNSRNGTFLNGNRVYKALLKNNDRIQLGKRSFTFSFERFDTHCNIHTESKNLEWSRQLKSLPDMAKSNMPVLITGPSGTGKEMLAKLIHRHSHRSEGPMVSINCSALSESLIESEFFGHVKGSYTGALSSRQGAFMSAKGGSLFLDEIGDLPLNLQPKLLRALEYQEIKPVGSDKVTKTDVRIIAATHQDLKVKVAQKAFRADLYFRLYVLNLSPPYLKARMEDFRDLLDFFSCEYNISFSSRAIRALRRHPWPGNIRELKNTVARAKALFSGTVVQEDQIQKLLYPASSLTTNSSFTTNKPRSSKEITFKEAKNLPMIKKMEKDLIVKTLVLCRGNQKNTAEELGMAPSSLSERMRKYKLKPTDYKK